MTEQAWLVCVEPKRMIDFVIGRASGRKFRLFAVACSRDLLAYNESMELWMSETSEKMATAIQEAEAYAEGRRPDVMGWWHWANGREQSDLETAYVALGMSPDPNYWNGDPDVVVASVIPSFRIHPSDHAREVFGNPLRPVSLESAWRTPTVLGIAEAAYDERVLPPGHLDPVRLAILSDALEEAGCTEAAILDHLRGPGPHVRGCWALDLILGKS